MTISPPYGPLLLPQWLLHDAVHQAYSSEGALWTVDAGERARVAQIFRHLCALVPHGWDVDCEYNREAAGIKRSDVNRSSRGTPDIVVHRRGASGREHNLLLAEFKNTYANQDVNSLDSRKVLEWTARFGYQVGAIVGLGPRGTIFAPKVQWVIGATVSQSSNL